MQIRNVSKTQRRAEIVIAILFLITAATAIYVMTTTTSPTPTTTRVPMTPLRKTALVAGLFYVLTFV